MTKLYYRDKKDRVRVTEFKKTEKGFQTITGLIDGSKSLTNHPVDFGLGGRSREEQIDLMIASKVSRLIDRGFVETIEAAKAAKPTNGLGYHKPMLARRFASVEEVYPYERSYIQRKLNGHRCIIRPKERIAYGRGGKIIKGMEGILSSIPENAQFPLDGELYRHGWKLQKISSEVRKHEECSEEIVFVCYDAIIEAPYSERLDYISSLDFGPRIQLIHTAMIYGKFNPYPICESYVREGYEGMIIRTDGKRYDDNERSINLLKLKPLIDKEFLVIDIFRSVEGWAKLRCKVEDGKYFNCSAPGSIEEKTEVFMNKEKFIGKYVTVEFPEYSEDGIPTQAVAVCWREEGEF